MIVLTKSFVPFEQSDRDIILKVTTAICYLKLADLNSRTNLPQASIQAVFIVLLFALVGSTNIYGPRSLWPTWRSPEVETSPIGIHVNRFFSSEKISMVPVRLTGSIRGL